MIMKNENSDKNKLKHFLSFIDDNIMTIDGHENAFMGVVNLPIKGYVAVYSTSQIIENLMRDDMMGFETAEDFVQYNIANAYVGEKTPMLLDIVPDFFWK